MHIHEHVGAVLKSAKDRTEHSLGEIRRSVASRNVAELHLPGRALHRVVETLLQKELKARAHDRQKKEDEGQADHREFDRCCGTAIGTQDAAQSVHHATIGGKS